MVPLISRFPPWLRRLGVRMGTGLAAGGRFLLIVWGTLALYYAAGPWIPVRVALALAFVGFARWSLRRDGRIFAAGLVAVFVWWGLLRPSHDRAWAPDVATLPHAQIEGDVVRLTGVRDFEYRSTTDFTPRWITREVRLSQLTGVDYFVSYWSPEPGLMGHTFLSFVFADAPPLCVSVEARKEQGEPYEILPSMFKRYELAYVVGEERDVVGVREGVRAESVYLYRLRVTPEDARKLFASYLAGINRLADEPQFYHLLKNNCTTNIEKHALPPERRPIFQWRVLCNGLSDELLYDAGLVDTDLSFAAVKRRSRLAPSVGSEIAAEFSARIRADLPPRREAARY